MKARLPLVVLGLTILVSIVAVIALEPYMAPIKWGTSAGFWASACGVKLDSAIENDFVGGIYPPRDGYFIYYVQGFSRQFLFKVPRVEVVADFPEVNRKIQQAALRTNAAPIFQWAASALSQQNESKGDSPEKFLASLRELRMKRLETNNHELYRSELAAKAGFNERCARAGRFWLNEVFEIAFFSGLASFTLWPWLRHAKGRKWFLHLGLAPFLLFLPFYCGYATWTFSDPGPSGGVLYPWVIFWFRGTASWTWLDGWIYQHIPKVLEPLSQLGLPPDVATGPGGPGPVECLLIGAAIAALTAAYIYLPNYLRRKTVRPGQT